MAAHTPDFLDSIAFQKFAEVLHEITPSMFEDADVMSRHFLESSKTFLSCAQSNTEFSDVDDATKLRLIQKEHQILLNTIQGAIIHFTNHTDKISTEINFRWLAKILDKTYDSLKSILDKIHDRQLFLKFMLRQHCQYSPEQDPLIAEKLSVFSRHFFEHTQTKGDKDVINFLSLVRPTSLLDVLSTIILGYKFYRLDMPQHWLRDDKRDAFYEDLSFVLDVVAESALVDPELLKKSDSPEKNLIEIARIMTNSPAVFYGGDPVPTLRLLFNAWEGRNRINWSVRILHETPYATPRLYLMLNDDETVAGLSVEKRIQLVHAVLGINAPRDTVQNALLARLSISLGENPSNNRAIQAQIFEILMNPEVIQATNGYAPSFILHADEDAFLKIQQQQFHGALVNYIRLETHKNPAVDHTQLPGYQQAQLILMRFHLINHSADSDQEKSKGGLRALCHNFMTLKDPALSDLKAVLAPILAYLPEPADTTPQTTKLMRSYGAAGLVDPTRPQPPSVAAMYNQL